MFGEIIKTIPGINILTIITTLSFFLMFMGTVIWAVRANKNYIRKMSELPLDSTVKNGE